MQTLAHRCYARSLRRALCAALLVIALGVFAVPGAAELEMVPVDGVWLIDGKGAAVQIFDCSGLICGRITGWRRRVIPLGGWRATTRTRIRYSESARCAA